MRAILKLKKLLTVVDTEPIAAVKAVATYDDNNTRACLYITQYVPDEIFSTVQHLTDSYDIWNALQALHEGSGAGKIARIMDILFHLGDTYTNAATHVGRLRQLAADIDAAEKLDGKTVARYFGIKMLPRQFDPLKPVLMNMHDKSFEDVCGLILDFERSHFQDVMAVQIRAKAQEFQQRRNLSSGSNAKQRPARPSQPNPPNQQNAKRAQCTYCRFFGHTINECRKLAKANQKAAAAPVPPKADAKPQPSQPSRLPSEQMHVFGWINCIVTSPTAIPSPGSSSHPVPSSFTLSSTDLIFDDEFDGCMDIDGAKSHEISDQNDSDSIPSSSPNNVTHQPACPDQSSNQSPELLCNVAPSTIPRNEEIWYLDSGATQSATNRRSNLSKLEPCQLRMGGATYDQSKFSYFYKKVFLFARFDWKFHFNFKAD